jgi:hypothetical protein
LIAELMSTMGNFSSDDDDESRVTNHSGNQAKQRKHSKGKKSSKKTSTVGGQELVDLEIQDIVPLTKYAILLYEEEEDQDNELFGDIDDDEVLVAGDNTTAHKRARPDTQAAKSKPKMTWFVGQAMSVQKEGEHVQVKVFSKQGDNWYPQLSDDAQPKKKKGSKKPESYLVQKFSVSNFLCRVDFPKKKHYPDKSSNTMIAAFTNKADYECDETFVMEYNVEDIFNHRLSETGLFMEYYVKWSSSEESWEPLESLSNCVDMLRKYEGKHLDSKALQKGSRVMIASTSHLMNNRHQIEFFQFKGKQTSKASNYFTFEDMWRLTSPSVQPRDKWVSSIIMIWYGHTLSKVNQSSHTCAIFSPHATTKFMQGTNEILQSGFVEEHYCEATCQYWLIPINWSGYTIPR